MSFLGSKAASGAYQALIAAMPPHDVYIESHLGSGAVMRRKPAAMRSIGIDRDPLVLAAFEPSYPVELHEGDWLEFLLGFDFAEAGRVFVFHDPPYLLSTRTSSRRYRCDYTDADHARFLAGCRALPALQMISGYPSRYYDEQLVGWRTLEFQVMTRGGVRTEKAWMNYPPAAHWSTFAGRNFSDRQRIKRKAARWAEHYQRMPPGERLAVLAALLNVEGQGPPATIDGRGDAAGGQAGPPATSSAATMSATSSATAMPAAIDGRGDEALTAADDSASSLAEVVNVAGQVDGPKAGGLVQCLERGLWRQQRRLAAAVQLRLGSEEAGDAGQDGRLAAELVQQHEQPQRHRAAMAVRRRK